MKKPRRCWRTGEAEGDLWKVIAFILDQKTIFVKRMEGENAKNTF